MAEDFKAEDDIKMEDNEEMEVSDTEPSLDSEINEEKNVSEDGGVVKKILKKGEGWRTPEKNAEVRVHYVGKLLDGTVFDSSRERNEEFTFVLGTGNVIKGWDLGVATMKKGELALLTCKPEYAYGANGSPPKIPANATLEFEVELIDWMEEKDISEEKDKSVLKKVIKEGDGWERPKEETKATISYKAFKEDGTTLLEEKQNFEFTVGAEEVVLGLEEAVSSMKKGEVARLVLSSKKAYGSEGNAALNVGPNETLKYEVELVSFEKEKEVWEMKKEEKKEFGLKKKEEGNSFFKEGKLKRAERKYKKALEVFESDHSLEEEEKKEFKSHKATIQVNLCLCKLKQNNYKEAIQLAGKALEVEPTNIKALYRRATAFIETGDWIAAHKDLDRALELEPENKLVQREKLRLRKLEKQQDEKDKKTFGGIFEKMAKKDEEREEKRRKMEEAKKAELKEDNKDSAQEEPANTVEPMVTK